MEDSLKFTRETTKISDDRNLYRYIFTEEPEEPAPAEQD